MHLIAGIKQCCEIGLSDVALKTWLCIVVQGFIESEDAGKIIG